MPYHITAHCSMHHSVPCVILPHHMTSPYLTAQHTTPHHITVWHGTSCTTAHHPPSRPRRPCCTCRLSLGCILYYLHRSSELARIRHICYFRLYETTPDSTSCADRTFLVVALPYLSSTPHSAHRSIQYISYHAQ